MSLLALLGQAAIPAADAMGSYMQGEQQEQDKQNALKRQSLLDQIDQAMKQSEIDANDAHANYYNGLGRQPASHWHETATGDVYNDTTGEVKPGAGSKKPAAIKDVNQYEPDFTDTASGYSGPAIVDIDTQGNRIFRRPATKVEQVLHNRVPRDPNAPPPESPDVVAERNANADRTAAAAKNAKADSILERFLGQNPNLAGSPKLSADMDAYTAALERNNDPGMAGLTAGDINAAIGRRVKPPTPDQQAMADLIRNGPPKKGGTSGAAGTVSGSASPPPSVTSNETGAVTAGARAMANDPRLTTAADRIRSGKATLQQLELSPSFTADEKATIRQLLGAP